MRLEHFIFCEIVRQEVNGSFTLIGLIPANEIEVSGPELPARLTFGNFCCFTVFDYMQDIPRLTTQIEVTKGANAEVIARTPPKTEPRSNPLARFHTEYFAFAPLQLPGVGSYQFKVIVSTGDRTQGFSKRLIFRARGVTE